MGRRGEANQQEATARVTKARYWAPPIHVVAVGLLTVARDAGTVGAKSRARITSDDGLVYPGQAERQAGWLAGRDAGPGATSNGERGSRLHRQIDGG